jgi:hypothetical protein
MRLHLIHETIAGRHFAPVYSRAPHEYGGGGDNGAPLGRGGAPSPGDSISGLARNITKFDHLIICRLCRRRGASLSSGRRHEHALPSL